MQTCFGWAIDGSDKLSVSSLVGRCRVNTRWQPKESDKIAYGKLLGVTDHFPP
jgi:hypothetical protein